MNRSSILLTVLGVVLVGALWWLFVYSPGQDELARIDEEIAAAEVEQASLEQRIAALELVRARAPETEAAIARLRGIIPEDPDLPGALRQVGAAAEDAGLDVESLSTSRPVVQDEVIGLYSVPIALAAQGSYFQVVDFLRRLEDPAITARGITVSDLSLATGVYPELTISITGQMYATLTPPPVADDEAAPADDTAAPSEDAEEPVEGAES